MTQSSEYPDLRWMPPKSWTNANRTSVQVVVIHDTEGAENVTAAEDGAVYDQRRTDGTSTHYFHDSNSTVQCVLTNDLAHAARTSGNRIGIQHELCGKASQGAAGWADAASAGTIRQAAKQAARDCRKWGIPVRRLTASQVADGVKGICGHADITKAFPADKGTHTDPGPTFPWDSFIAQVKQELAKLIQPEVDTVASIVDDLNAALKEKPDGSGGGNLAWNLRKLALTYPTGQSAKDASFLTDFAALFAAVKALQEQVSLLAANKPPAS